MPRETARINLEPYNEPRLHNVSLKLISTLLVRTGTIHVFIKISFFTRIVFILHGSNVFKILARCKYEHIFK
jgi:hypothetical protein